MRGQVEALMGLVTAAALIVMLFLFFSIKGKLTVMELLSRDPSLPLLLSITSSSVDLGSECSSISGGCDAQSVYDLLSLSSVSSNEVIDVCGGTCNVTKIVEDRLRYYNEDIGETFGFILKNSTKGNVFEVGRTPRIMEERGKEVMEVRALEYLIPMPPDEHGNVDVSYAIMMEVRVACFGDIPFENRIWGSVPTC